MRTALHAAALLGLGLLLAGCPEPQPAPAPGPPKNKLTRFSFPDPPSNQPTGDAAPVTQGEDAEFVTKEGRVVHLREMRGKPLVLVFTRGFAGDICPFCTTYTAQIAARYDEIRALNAEVLLVYPTRDTDQATVDRFVAACNEALADGGEESLPFPVFLDPGLRAVSRFNLVGELSKPSTFVVDAAGVVRYAFVGTAPPERPSVDRILAELRALAAPPGP